MAVAAAKKADDIINAIVTDVDAPLTSRGKFARHGEARIKNCVKFDIGKGHRLVCVKEKDHFYLLFIGTHDDCAAWIENNRNIKPEPQSGNFITRRVSEGKTGKTQVLPDTRNETDYEELLLARITEKDLQYVFKGLTVLL